MTQNRLPVAPRSRQGHGELGMKGPCGRDVAFGQKRLDGSLCQREKVRGIGHMCGLEDDDGEGSESEEPEDEVEEEAEGELDEEDEESCDEDEEED